MSNEIRAEESLNNLALGRRRVNIGVIRLGPGQHLIREHYSRITLSTIVGGHLSVPSTPAENHNNAVLAFRFPTADSIDKR